MKWIVDCIVYIYTLWTAGNEYDGLAAVALVPGLSRIRIYTRALIVRAVRGRKTLRLRTIHSQRNSRERPVTEARIRYIL